MARFSPGDRVRIDIPNRADPDFEFHGENGTIVSILTDDADEVTGIEGDGLIYTVRLDSGDQLDLRGRDIRPPID